MSLFPGALPSFAGFTSSHTLVADNHGAQHNLEQAEIVQIATKLGIGGAAPTSGSVLRGTATGTSAWGQASLVTDVTGVLPVTNGGTGVSSSTGTGSVVLGTSPSLTTPTLTTPVIADFTSANHNHQNTAGGGQLNAANALNPGSVSFANLLETIFSGQLQSQANAGSAGGTMWWVNLGGIKILWATSDPFAVGTGGQAIVFTLPTFFTTLQSYFPSIMDVTIDANQYATVTGHSISAITIFTHSGTNGSTQQTGLLVIGT